MRFGRVAAGLLAAGLAAALAGCHGSHADRHLNVYNWADYIGQHTIADFERETGIRVDYDTFDSDTTMEAKMLTGGSGYDIVTTSQNYFARQIRAGAFRPVDRSKLPNWKNLDPRVVEIYARYDPGNRYAVPYLHAINGFAYNVDMVRAWMPDAPVDSLDMLFRPDVVSRFAGCGVTFLDSPEDVLQLALRYLHLDPNSTRAEDYQAAEKLVMAVRPYIKTFDSSDYLNGLANGDYCVAMSWSSDYAVSMARAREAKLDVKLAFTVPREGANVTYSALLIPADAPHVAEAHAFLNFVLRPEVVAAITNDTHYGNDNLAANALVAPEILNDPTLYPTPAIGQRLYLTAEVGPQTERMRTRIWTRIKTAH